MPEDAIIAFAWGLQYASELTGHSTVTVDKEEPGKSFLGGTPGKVFCMMSVTVCFHGHEMLGFFSPIILLCMVRCGPFIFFTRCMAVGNHYGRIAIFAVTSRRAILFDARWAQRRFRQNRWRDIAAKYRREQVFAHSLYVGDLDQGSLIACEKCGDKVVRMTFTIKFSKSGDRKFLDMNQRFARGRPGARRGFSSPRA